MAAARPYRILVVDDFPDSIRALAETLSEGYTVLAANNGEDALRIARSDSPPDLILMDITMPGMDGFAVCEELKKNGRGGTIPIIFLTASDEIGMKIRGFAMGAVDYITKPFVGEEVLSRVGTHIALVEARKALESQNRELVEAATLREDVELMTRHDLKSPLNGIIGIPQLLLQDKGLSVNQRRYLGMILDSGKKMLRMINLSQDLFRMERRIYSVKTEEVDVLEVLAEVAREFAELARSLSLVVRIELDGRLPEGGDSRLVLGEELLCYSLFSNLLKNCIEAAPAASVITIEVAGAESVTVRLTNRGEVPPEIRATFFEKYVTRGKEFGTGLGTYSARLIAGTLGGRIALDSTREGLTTVTVELPGVPGRLAPGAL